MATYIYRIVQSDDGVAIDEGGTISMTYLSREAAFEAAVGPASNAVREGHDVVIEVKRDAATGTETSKTHTS